MGTNGNGNGHAIPREDDGESGETHAIPLPSSPVEVAEYVRAAVETSTRTASDLTALRGELRGAWREQAETNGMVLAALARIEHTTTTTRALAEETALRVAVLARDADVTDRTVADLRKAVAAKGTGYSPRDAAALARLEAKVEVLEKRSDRIEADVDDTQRRAVVDLAEARAKLASVADVAEESREVRREERDDRRHTKRWALGLVGAVVLAVVTTLLGVKATAPVEHEPAAHESK